MTDAPLWSPGRILMALRRWIWWGGDQGLWFPFWFFMRFEGRPAARKVWTEDQGHRVHISKDSTPWYTREEMWG